VEPRFSKGDRVQHEQFGRGVILEVRGQAHAARARVKFRDHGEKDLILQYARMTKVEA
jgi:DNA helicase-2/ATP-dependent DNA helicase PcrA